MPCGYSKYPNEWPEIRHKILLRAGGDKDKPRYGACCEWCGVENYTIHPETQSRVILTIAHLDDPDPMNVDDDNLAALCQKCHNTYDAPMRVRNRAKRKRAEEVDAGQLEIFDDGDV